jgi:hypothetical protein
MVPPTKIARYIWRATARIQDPFIQLRLDLTLSGTPTVSHAPDSAVPGDDDPFGARLDAVPPLAFVDDADRESGCAIALTATQSELQVVDEGVGRDPVEAL